MTNRERFHAVLNGKTPDDRLPVIEWAYYWNLTRERWNSEGLDPTLTSEEVFEYFGLDAHTGYTLPFISPNCPLLPGKDYYIENEEDYDRIRDLLYPDDLIHFPLLDTFRELEPRHQAGDIIFHYNLRGPFWFPRVLFGIEPHLYSFYDYPELYHRIIEDLADFHMKQLEELYKICTPEYMYISEDMSYNNGPMLSKEIFFEFLAPYYRRIVPYIREHGTTVLVDSDGEVSMLIPWLEEVGVQGISPLEYMAGVDVAQIRRDHPNFFLMGGFNKVIMKDGEAAMRAEFERLLPTVRKGRFVPTVDHQTPPDVSMDTYRTFVKLLFEYAEKAIQPE